LHHNELFVISHRF